jgi:hypothetical protein
MLEPYGLTFIEIGEQLSSVDSGIRLIEGMSPNDPDRVLRSDELTQIIETFVKMADVFKKIDMPVSLELLSEVHSNPPQTSREILLIRTVIISEIKSKTFLFVPPHLSKYYDVVHSSLVTTAFPSATKELISSGNCLAVGLATACVFHAMRAAEIGVRSLGVALNVSFPDKPLELAEWANILDQADSKIVAMKLLPRGANKDEELKILFPSRTTISLFQGRMAYSGRPCPRNV